MFTNGHLIDMFDRAVPSCCEQQMKIECLQAINYTDFSRTLYIYKIGSTSQNTICRSFGKFPHANMVEKHNSVCRRYHY